MVKPDLRPMLATLTDKPFNDPDWVFETKWDGFRDSAPPGSAAADKMMKATDSASCGQAGGMWDDAAKKCSEKKTY